MPSDPFRRPTFLVAVAALAGMSAASAGPAFTDPAKTDDDFAFQGEYAGEISGSGGSTKYGVQVVALGAGAFDVVAYPGGLPGAGWAPPAPKATGKGVRDGTGDAARVAIEGQGLFGTAGKAEIRGRELAVLDADGKRIALLPKVARKSPTLGQKPPAGAVLLYDGLDGGKDTDRLAVARVSDDGLLMEGVTSKDGFGDAVLHVEFRLPYQPQDRGQGRGNSGVYMQGAYEVQVLDSFGLEGRNNECGGIYSIAAPKVNMCLPPLEWQTYDIEFTAPRFEGDKKVANARLTVRHNGVVVQENTEVPGITPAGTSNKEQPTGPLHLQNHGNPVRYRNVWVLPKEARPGTP